jgi:hypothetical protein
MKMKVIMDRRIQRAHSTYIRYIRRVGRTSTVTRTRRCIINQHYNLPGQF